MAAKKTATGMGGRCVTDTNPVLLEHAGNLAVVSLNRPACLNAIDDGLCRAMLGALDEIEKVAQARVIILRGHGRAFSAGADLKHMRKLADRELRRFIELTWVMGERLSRSPLLSIAALHGYVLGGGAELAIACDLRIAAETAIVGFPEMALGSVPGSGAMQILPELIGFSRALELVVGGRRLDGREAHALGLVNRLAPEAELDAQAREWAASFAARPAEAIRYAKACLRLPRDSSAAAFVHGLVSGACQSEAGYRANVDGFAARSSAI